MFQPTVHCSIGVPHYHLRRSSPVPPPPRRVAYSHTVTLACTPRSDLIRAGHQWSERRCINGGFLQPQLARQWNATERSACHRWVLATHARSLALPGSLHLLHHCREQTRKRLRPCIDLQVGLAAGTSESLGSARRAECRDGASGQRYHGWMGDHFRVHRVIILIGSSVADAGLHGTGGQGAERERCSGKGHGRPGPRPGKRQRRALAEPERPREQQGEGKGLLGVLGSSTWAGSASAPHTWERERHRRPRCLSANERAGEVW
jgi:hypothetical protein